MQNPLEFYTQEKAKFVAESQVLKKKIINISTIRFLVFAITCSVIFFNFKNTILATAVAVVGFSIFIFLVLKNSKLKRQQKIITKKTAINSTEINVLQGNFHNLETGATFTNSNHFYSNDIDLFGIGSFFQYTNRTVTKQGKIALAKLLLANHTNAIEAKQKVVQELAKKIQWRQHFSALASLVTVKKSIEETLNWVKNYKAVFSSKKHLLPKIFSIFSILLIVLVSFGSFSFSILLIWFFIGLLLSGYHIKKTSSIYNKTDKIRETVKQYHILLNEIERANFLDETLKNQQKKITLNQKNASVIVKDFSKILDAFDQRNNIIIAVIGNGLFLWDLKNACATEKWLTTYQNTIQKWFDVVAFFDAQNSLANFTFNKPYFTFPKINTTENGIAAENLGHPLLNPSKRIDNDFHIKNDEFHIVTGANMAGKSTFLRTVSLSIVMANCGLPVCAKSFKYSPIKLLTSMRTSDSLTDDESYFYSELKRLKFIVDEINTDNYFIILDEILKGTNSKDKAIGSKKFVEKLTKSNATGIIATHDVSLCELEDEFKSISNYYFDATITNNELYFDYKLKNGICKNMNASFLLEKMEIID